MSSRFPLPRLVCGFLWSALLSCLVGVGPIVGAQEVLSIAVSATGTGGDELGDLLTQSAELELQRLGFRLAQGSVEPSHLIELEYRTEDSIVELEAGLSARTDDALLAERWTEGKIDLTLDDTVTALVRDLLDGAGIEPSEGKPLPVIEELPEESSQAVLDEGAPRGEVVDPPTIARDPFFQINSGFAPFFPLGEVARYAGVGQSPSLSFRRTWVPGSVEVSAGILAAGHNLSMTGAVTNGSSWFIPVGAAFWLSSPTEDQIMAAHLFVSAGGAATIVTPEAGEIRRSILPFILGGLGVTFPLSSRIGLSLETGYVTILDGTLPISGFLPTLLVYYRL